MSEQVVHFQPRSPGLRVADDRVVTLQYALYDRDADSLLEYRDLVYLHGDYEGSLPAVVQALDGKAVGDRVELELEPEQAYGQLDPRLVITAELAQFPAEARQVGARLDGEAPDGGVVPFRVVAVGPDSMTVDGNHPYAGKRLRFVIEVREVRRATEAELSDGYAHAMVTETS